MSLPVPLHLPRLLLTACKRLALTLGMMAVLACHTPARCQQVATLFTPEERARLVTYWSAPGRCVTDLPPEAAKSGPWQVRLTVDGSRWFWNYHRALGLGKLAPTIETLTSPEAQRWELWVSARVEQDRWQAQKAADAANELLGVRVVMAEAPAAPPEPGPIPADLLSAVGNPPAFATAATPMRSLIRFEDGEAFEYDTHVAVRPRYAHYRFAQGARHFGVRLRDMPAAELDALFNAAGLTPSEQRIARAVSLLEGGFEAVNTYDTGYVSIGFIQFITSENGRGSLARVLLREKTDRPDDFQRDFHAYGIDVAPDSVVTAVDPRTGAELTGPAAVSAMIEDKRLVAVFQRAGRRSTAFRVAQILTAKSGYWPTEDVIRVKVGDHELTGKVSDLIRSEAGIATLFDRKVNRGNVQPLAEVVGRVMMQRGLTTLAAAARYERQIIAEMKYREDFLSDPTLGQPEPLP